MKIRPETENDYLKVENLVRDSFWNIYRPGAYEHYIVHMLRKDPSFIKDLAYVIEKDSEIIGHINYSYGTLLYDSEKCVKAIVLGPIAIDKNHHGQGYGTKLIQHTLSLIEKENEDFVFVIGDENYYRKFGFESASKYNIFLNGTDYDEECPFFMIKVLNDFEINYKRAIFTNPEIFDVDSDDVEEFDKGFEFKQKKILDGQLEV